MSKDMHFHFRTSSEWLDMMKEYAKETPLSLSAFIQLAAEDGAETISTLYKREPKKNEEVHM